MWWSLFCVDPHKQARWRRSDHSAPTRSKCPTSTSFVIRPFLSAPLPLACSNRMTSRPSTMRRVVALIETSSLKKKRSPSRWNQPNNDNTPTSRSAESPLRPVSLYLSLITKTKTDKSVCIFKDVQQHGTFKPDGHCADRKISVCDRSRRGERNGVDLIANWRPTSSQISTCSWGFQRIWVDLFSLNWSQTSITIIDTP